MPIMRILFIAKNYLPHLGGVEKHVEQIIKRLKKKKVKVNLVCEYSKNTKPYEVLDGLPVYRINYPHIQVFGLLSIWWWFWKNRELIKRAEIVHCHDVFIWYLPFRILYFKKSVFTTFHGWEGVFPIPFKNKFLKQLSAKLSWGNICVGKYIEKWYGLKANFITYGGTNVSNLKKSLIQKKIIYIGRLDEDTGIRIYLEAFRLIKQTNTQIKFEFLGDGEFKQEAKKIGKVYGFKKNPDRYLNKAKFVCTSGYLSILKAFSLKKLVFAVYNNPLKKDSIEMSPFKNYVLLSKNAKDLVQKISYFLTYPNKENKLTVKSFDFVISQTWDSLFQIYLKLWKI